MAVKSLVLGFVSLRTAKLSIAGALLDKRREDQFGDWVEAEMTKTGVPGMAAAVVVGGETVFAKGYGSANAVTHDRVKTDTIFHLASVSKLVTGTTLMMLQERKRFQLDDPIARFADFSVVHPKFPKERITFRHLLTHTSGISDGNYASSFTEPGDPKLSLRDFLTGYLSPGGRWYTSDGSFLDAAPGSRWSYSNVGMALAGYLVGRIGAISLDAFSRDEIFGPLGMNDTAWFLRDLKRPRNLAAPHVPSRDGLCVIDPIGYPDWPAGLLRSSVTDLAQFLGVFANQTIQGFRASRIKVLPTTLAEMLERQPMPDSRYQALVWAGHLSGHKLRLGHAGGDPGAATSVALDPDRRKGVIVLMNVSPSNGVNLFKEEAINRLFDLS